MKELFLKLKSCIWLWMFQRPIYITLQGQFRHMLSNLWHLESNHIAVKTKLLSAQPFKTVEQMESLKCGTCLVLIVPGTLNILKIRKFGRAKEQLISSTKVSFSLGILPPLWITTELSISPTFAKIRRINVESTLPFMVVQWEWIQHTDNLLAKYMVIHLPFTQTTF